MKTNQLVIIGIIIVAVVGIVATSSDKPKVQDPAEPKIDLVFKTEYMKGCSTDGHYAYCECTYNAMRNKYGLDGFINIALQYQQTNVMPKEMLTAVSSCISTYNN